MATGWLVVVLIITPFANAWQASTEDQRDPADYRRDVRVRKDVTEYRRDLRELRDTPEFRKDVIVYRRNATSRKDPTERREDITNYRRDLSERRKDIIEYQNDPTERREDQTERRKDMTDYRKDPTERRKDMTDYRKDPTERRKHPTEHPNDATEFRKDPIRYRREPRELRKVHFHAKRHMLPETEKPKKRTTTSKPFRDIRKKPSGHLAPLEDDDMEIDEVVSVAIGPPPLRGKYEKIRKKHTPKPTAPPTTSAIGLVKDLFSQITKEFLSRDVDENFVFGQYLGNAMKNLTSELRLSMQHDILELIVKYQKANKAGETKPEAEKTPEMLQILKDVKVEKKFMGSNDTEESWPDFSNLAKIVG